MKTLPDSPSLDHLRQQAKDLVTQMRVLRPDATLSEAQTVVAEQHGFRIWPDLKAEVDRRCATPASRRHPATGASTSATRSRRRRDTLPRYEEPVTTEGRRLALQAHGVEDLTDPSGFILDLRQI